MRTSTSPAAGFGVPQASERQDCRIHELGSLSFFSLPGLHLSPWNIAVVPKHALQIVLRSAPIRAFAIVGPGIWVPATISTSGVSFFRLRRVRRPGRTGESQPA